MTRHASILILTAAVVMLSGCGNSLLFYETGKLSLTIEGMPDSSQPVQANLGFKQRTALVAPPMNTGGKATNAGSMISSFRVDKRPGWGPLTLQTALVTGKAARGLTPSTASRVAQVVAGATIPTDNELATMAISNAKNQGRLADLEALLATNWSDLSDDQKTDLGAITGSFSGYDQALHEALQAELKE